MRSSYGKWTVEALENKLISYEWGTSLQIDSRGQPHLTYYDEVTKALYYARKVDQQWAIYNVDSAGDVGRFSSMALDQQDTPLISYVEVTGPNNSKTSRYLKLARLKEYMEGEPVWETERINKMDNLDLASFGANKSTSIVLNDAGQPIVAYADQQFIKLAYPGGSGWQTEVIDESGPTPFSRRCPWPRARMAHYT